MKTANGWELLFAGQGGNRKGVDRFTTRQGLLILGLVALALLGVLLLIRLLPFEMELDSRARTGTKRPRVKVFAVGASEGRSFQSLGPRHEPG
jgi:hypothetical protein